MTTTTTTNLDPKNLSGKQADVYQALKSRRWTAGEEIEAAGGLRRLRELRAAGFPIETRKTDGAGKSDYRLARNTK